MMDIFYAVALTLTVPDIDSYAGLMHTLLTPEADKIAKEEYDHWQYNYPNVKNKN